MPISALVCYRCDYAVTYEGTKFPKEWRLSGKKGRPTCPKCRGVAVKHDGTTRKLKVGGGIEVIKRGHSSVDVYRSKLIREGKLEEKVEEMNARCSRCETPYPTTAYLSSGVCEDCWSEKEDNVAKKKVAKKVVKKKAGNGSFTRRRRVQHNDRTAEAILNAKSVDDVFKVALKTPNINMDSVKNHQRLWKNGHYSGNPGLCVMVLTNLIRNGHKRSQKAAKAKDRKKTGKKSKTAKKARRKVVA